MFIYGRDGDWKYVDYNFDGFFDMKWFEKDRFINVDGAWYKVDYVVRPFELVANNLGYIFDVNEGKWINGSIKN